MARTRSLSGVRDWVVSVQRELVLPSLSKRSSHTRFFFGKHRSVVGEWLSPGASRMRLWSLRWQCRQGQVGSGRCGLSGPPSVKAVCLGQGPERGDLHGGWGQADRGKAVLCGACTGRLPRIFGTGLGRCWDRPLCRAGSLE